MTDKDQFGELNPNIDQQTLVQLLDHEWLQCNALVGVLLASRYNPLVKVEPLPDKIDLSYVQALINWLLKSK